MAAPLQNVLENFIEETADNTAEIISNDIINKDLSLIEFVENLGPHLTNTETSVRARATRLVAEVLHKLPADFLLEKEVDLLSTFLCEKLQDHHFLQPHALFGILALVKVTHFQKGLSEKICRIIFKEVHSQSLLQGDRYVVYCIISQLLHTKREELLTMGGDFVFGFIQTMDAEKDPRNLALAFQTAKIIIQNFPLGVFVEEMFEVVSCYFPVDFTPPPNDPHGIKKEDLIHGLRECMAATPLFAPHCLPLLLEKMNSDIVSAKLDAFQTLIMCTKVYGAESLREFISSLFSSIKREVFISGDDQVVNAALEAIKTITATMSRGILECGSKTSLEGFLDEILQECKRHLCEPDLRLMQPCCQILQSVASASDPACCKILGVSVPLLIEQHTTHTQATQKRNILQSLIGFLQVTVQFSYSEDAPNPVCQYKDTLLSICLTHLSETNQLLRCVSISSLAALLSLPSVLNDTDRVSVTKTLLNLILTDYDALVRLESKTALAYVATTYPEIVKEEVLPVMLSKLKTEPMETEQQHNGSAFSASHTYIMNILTALCVHADISKIIIQEFTLILNTLSNKNSNHRESCMAAVKCIQSATEANLNHSSVIEYLFSETIPNLIRLCVTQSVEQSESVFHDHEFICSVCGTVQYISQVLDRRKACDLCRRLINLFLDGDLLCFSILVQNKFIQLLEEHSPWQETQLVSVLMACICSVCKEVEIRRLKELLDKLLLLSLLSRHEFTCEKSRKCLAGLLNKYEGEHLDEYIKSFQVRLSSLLQSASTEERQKAFSVWVWIAKALVLRSHFLSQEFIDEILNRLSDVELGLMAAESFEVILKEHDDVMNKSMHANIKIMYKQRLFIENVSHVVDGFKKADRDSRKNYLTALSHMLRNLPKQVLLSELPPLLPLLVHSLSSDDINLQLSTMTSLLDLIQDAPSLISTQVESLLPLLLKLSQYEPLMTVRIAALKCVEAMVTLPGHIIVPHQKRVVKELEPALDDKKRLVRKEAVAARSAWFLIG